MSDTTTDARRSAIYLLDQVLGEQRLLSECLAAGALERLAPQDRARAQRLATETLRGLERADRLLRRNGWRSTRCVVWSARIAFCRNI